MMRRTNRGTSLWRQGASAFLGSTRASADPQLYKLTQRQLIQLESEIGRELFGAVPKGHRREFFNTGPHTWVWHEEWLDAEGKPSELTTRYDIKADGIWKSQPGLRYTRVQGDELDNFRTAARIYYERVMREIYRRDPTTGRPPAA